MEMRLKRGKLNARRQFPDGHNKGFTSLMSGAPVLYKEIGLGTDENFPLSYNKPMIEAWDGFQNVQGAYIGKLLLSDVTVA